MGVPRWPRRPDAPWWRLHLAVLRLEMLVVYGTLAALVAYVAVAMWVGV